jgi:NADH-quinone oxidoreductase subunit L
MTTSSLLISAAELAIFLLLGGAEPQVIPVRVHQAALDRLGAARRYAAVMLVVVATVSALHLYSWGYMEEDPSQPRFFAYLSLFSFAMLMLVTADSLVQMFFGWEGVGLASYLLIGFWYKKPSANAAAIKAFIVNRVGDFGLRWALALPVFGTLDRRSSRPLRAGRHHLSGFGAASRCSCCCSSAPWASRPSSACTPGCPTRWKARPRCRP